MAQNSTLDDLKSWGSIWPPHFQVASYSPVMTKELMLDESLGCRDESILLFFSPIFLSSNSFFPSYYAQNFA